MVASDMTDEYGLPLWPAAERNKQPIADALRDVLPTTGHLLEIASGTGQHASYLVMQFPGWTVRPSDCDPEHLETLRRRVDLANQARLLPPLTLDVTASQWPHDEPTAIYCANMLHIAPWAACAGLFAVAAQLLGDRGPLITYGPYAIAGKHTAPSNLEFDASLRKRNPAWGVRDVEDVKGVAAEHGFQLARSIEMPANNLLLVWSARVRST